MNANEEKILYQALSYKIVGLAMKVHTKLGPGFLEKVYENALMVLFRREGIQAAQQVPMKVYFEGEEVGFYVADILVETKVILELKVAENLSEAHKAQTLNYLKATGLRLALVLNFGKTRLQYERIVH